jgi:hypothetical protein
MNIIKMSKKDTLKEEVEFKKKNRIEWTKEHEDILVDWGDKSMCYRWLHSKSNEDYSNQNTWFTIPVIIMSTITGTANFAQDQFPTSIKSYAPMIIGSVNIFAGIITTIQQFLKINELNEAHRVSAISWDKFYRKIKVEISKSPNERQNVTDFIKLCSDEYDRLIETSPDIKQHILDKFSETFEGKLKKKSFYKICCGYICDLRISKEDRIKKNMLLNQRYELFKEIKKPVICNNMESLSKSVYRAGINEKIIKKNNNIIDIIKYKQEVDNKENIIINFKEKFKKEFHRDPSEQEIIDNLLNEDKNLSIEKIKGFIHKWKYNKDIKKEKNNIEMNIINKDIIDNIV